MSTLQWHIASKFWHNCFNCHDLIVAGQVFSMRKRDDQDRYYCTNCIRVPKNLEKVIIFDGDYAGAEVNVPERYR